MEILRGLGFGATEADDPYAAMAELCRRPLVYRAVILSLASLYREELSMIPAVKARFPHVEVWLAQTDGRQAALAEGMRLGADGLLAEDGLHRVAHPAVPGAPSGTTAAATWSAPSLPAAADAQPGNFTLSIQEIAKGGMSVNLNLSEILYPFSFIKIRRCLVSCTQC
jgi:DNA-binding NarL/FixJ family response regulator